MNEHALKIIQAPIEANSIEWKIQSYTKDKSKTIIVPYITARCVMERFDIAFGVDGWQTSFREVTGGFICNLQVATDKGWISKEDGASATHIEPVKGGISDSLKRAAHQFGLGRNLYDYPKVMLKGEQKYLSDDIMKRLHQMTELINKNEFTKNVVVL